MLLKDEEFRASIDPKDNDEDEDEEEDEEEEEEDEEDKDEFIDDELTSFTDLGRTNLEFVAKSLTGFLAAGI